MLFDNRLHDFLLLFCKDVINKSYKSFVGVYVDSPTDFLVDTRGIPKAGVGDDGKVTCTITNPSGAQTEKLVTPLLDGTYKVSYTPFEEGRHTIDIFYNNVPVPGSPFIVNVRRGCDAKKCRAFGPGLDQGFVNKSNIFTVETKGSLNYSIVIHIKLLDIFCRCWNWWFRFSDRRSIRSKNDL